MAAADLDKLGSMFLNYSLAGYGRNEHYYLPAARKYRHRSAARRTTDFADARFVIILEMCDRATWAVYFLPVKPGLALIEQPAGWH